MALTSPLFPREGQGKNFIVLVSDGMGSTHTTITRWYKGAPLALDQMDLGAVRTYSADSLVTDSAPAATAFATGHKSRGKLIGVLPKEVTIPGVLDPPEDLKYKPVATILDAAKLYSKSVGMVATSNVQHATPAAYSSHWHDRWDYQEIAKQQVYLDMDVVLGGGRRYLIPREVGGARSDQTNLIDTLRSRGYALVETRDELMKSRPKKVWGLFADDAMAYELDRKYFFPKKEPSLFNTLGASVRIDRTARENPVLRVEKGSVTALLPLSKDLMKVRAVMSNSNVLEAEYELEGIVVISVPTGKVYVPGHALMVFQSMLSYAQGGSGAPTPLDK